MTLWTQFKLSELSPAELDEEMYERIETGQDDCARLKALQREHDRRES
jgi:hypothetical protein